MKKIGLYAMTIIFGVLSGVFVTFLIFFFLIDAAETLKWTLLEYNQNEVLEIARNYHFITSLKIVGIFTVFLSITFAFLKLITFISKKAAVKINIKVASCIAFYTGVNAIYLYMVLSEW